MTAARGRGKSAALGLGIAAAVAFGYSNIFVTSPSPENLKTLFEFVFQGFDAVHLEEHEHYDIIQSTNPEFNKAVVRINVYSQHRQTIQVHILLLASLLSDFKCYMQKNGHFSMCNIEKLGPIFLCVTLKN